MRREEEGTPIIWLLVVVVSICIIVGVQGQLVQLPDCQMFPTTYLGLERLPKLSCL